MNCPGFTLLLFGILGLAAVGCRPGGARPLALVVSGDVDGWIAPCNCTSNQSGGLARRAEYIGQLRRESAVIAADAGGAAGGASLYDRLKFEAILRGEALMGTAAHNIGGGEAKLGPEYLKAVSAKTGVPLISANARGRDGRPVAEPMRIVNSGGRRVALLGVLGEQYATAEIDVAPPCPALLDALRPAAGKFDDLIVLAYLPDDELRRLAEALPEADAIVGGPTGQPIAPQPVGPVLLASATNKGKFVVRLDAPLPGRSDRWSGVVAELSDKFADEPRLTANLAAFRAELGRKAVTPAQTSFVESSRGVYPPHYGLSGTASCRSCHADDDRLWAASRHAKAWDSLKKDNALLDPECQRCHTTGYGLPGGFVSPGASGDRTGVGCECCHGPSRAHAAKSEIPTPYAGRAKDRCTGCHDRENSPDFNFDEFWKKIEHGTEPAADDEEKK